MNQRYFTEDELQRMFPVIESPETEVVVERARCNASGFTQLFWHEVQARLNAKGCPLAHPVMCRPPSEAPTVNPGSQLRPMVMCVRAALIQSGARLRL